MNGNLYWRRQYSSLYQISKLIVSTSERILKNTNVLVQFCVGNRMGPSKIKD